MFLGKNRYEVIGRLGEGGFGRVYLVKDTGLGKTWAVKDIGTCDDVAFAMLKAEVSVLIKASHPGIVRITDVFFEEGHAYIVMDHVSGMDLKKLLSTGRRITERSIFRWSIEICEAVAYLHNMSPPVILRDIKPQNIMIRPDGHVVLIDFGAAYSSHCRENISFGSKAYAAPEQLESGKCDIRSDVYSLGRVLDALSGKNKPFGMSAVIRRCTMKHPAFRYRSIKAVRRDLLFVRNLGKPMIIAALILIAGCLFLTGARESAEDVNEKARTEQAFSKALMCFYELGDYDAAIRYLGEVPKESFPEKEFYIEMSESLGGISGPGQMESTLRKFEEYNESVVRTESEDRYIKNLFCIVKAYLSSDGGKEDYDKAYLLAEKLAKLCETAGGGDSVMGDADVIGTAAAGAGGAAGEAPGTSGKPYEKDSLCLLINTQILGGRADESVKQERYHAAIEDIDRLITLPEISDDDAFVVSRLMDKASLYTELGEYAEAIVVYERAEERYPENTGIKYLTHMSLLLQTSAPSSEISSLWSDINRIEGIENDIAYNKMKERVENVIITDDGGNNKIHGEGNTI
ncbi:MAG: protein kinase [Lachnospiraceae bacterium]|nr:protein kinase [Lachnospiraceae bacterium]